MLAVGVLVACGGGGGGGASTDATASTPSSIVSGAVVKGPVSGATVCAYQLLPTGKGAPLGCTETQPGGSYSLSLDYTGEIIIEAVGGSYTDEATGLANVPLSAPLAVAGSIVPGTQLLVVTPLTSLALSQASAGGALSAAAFDQASAAVATAFGLSGELKLSRTLPAVTAGETNPYGDALVGVSKMVRRGAKLEGIIANTSLVTLAAGYAQATRTDCGGWFQGFTTSQSLALGVDLTRGGAVAVPASSVSGSATATLSVIGDFALPRAVPVSAPPLRILCLPLSPSGIVQTVTASGITVFADKHVPWVGGVVLSNLDSSGGSYTVVSGGTLVVGGNVITTAGAGSGTTPGVTLSGATSP